MAATRLRKAFQYPGDPSNDSSPAEGLDEQEQETLITSLTQQDQSSTALHRNILLALTSFILILYLAPFTPLASPLGAFSTTASAFSFVAFLSGSSTTLSLATLWDVPSSGLDSRTHTAVTSTFARTEHLFARISTRNGALKSAPRWDRNGNFAQLWIYYFGDGRSAPCDWVVETNACVATALLLFAIFGKGGTGLLVMPALFDFVIVLLACREFCAVDVRGLERLRYQYKGA